MSKRKLDNWKSVISGIIFIVIFFQLSPAVAGDHGFDFTNDAITGNQNILGEVLNDIYNGSPTPDMDDVLDEIRGLSDEERPGAYNQIAPQTSLGSSMVTTVVSNQNSANLFSRISQVRTGAGLT